MHLSMCIQHHACLFFMTEIIFFLSAQKNQTARIEMELHSFLQFNLKVD